jgi:hypothetical protein
MKPPPTTAVLIRFMISSFYVVSSPRFRAARYNEHRTMVVRIHVKPLGPFRRRTLNDRTVAVAVAAFLTPAAVMSCLLAIWRIAADLGTTGEFAIAHGLFSRWQVWVAIAIALQGLAWKLNRYAADR